MRLEVAPARFACPRAYRRDAILDEIASTLSLGIVVVVVIYCTNLAITNHRRAVVQTCVNGVNGEWQNLTPCRSETPQPIDTKSKTGNYVREATPCAKFRANPSIGGFWAKG